jgi:hypothetical protein
LDGLVQAPAFGSGQCLGSPNFVVDVARLDTKWDDSDPT